MTTPTTSGSGRRSVRSAACSSSHLPAGVSRLGSRRRGNRSGSRGLVSHHEKIEITAEVEDSLPPGSSGIAAPFEERWVAAVEKALASADGVSKHEVDRGRVD